MHACLPKVGPCCNWASVGAGAFTDSKGLLEQAVGGVTAGGSGAIPNGLTDEVGGGRGAVSASRLTRVALVPKNDSSTFCGFYNKKCK